MAERDPKAAWGRYKSGSGPLHELTVDIARAIHNEQHAGVDGRLRKSWDEDVVSDQWLAVGSWQTAEAVVKVLPMGVMPWRARVGL